MKKSNAGELSVTTYTWYSWGSGSISETGLISEQCLVRLAHTYSGCHTPATGEDTCLSSASSLLVLWWTWGLLLLTLSELALTAKLMLICSPLTSSVFMCTQTSKQMHKYLNLSYPLIFLNNDFLSPDHLCGLLFSFQSYIMHPAPHCPIHKE